MNTIEVEDNPGIAFCDRQALAVWNIRKNSCPLWRGIAGGFPFAVFTVAEEFANTLSIGDHAGTYCGNPLAWAVSLAVIQYLVDHNVAARVTETGTIVLDGLTVLARKYLM